MLKGLILFPNEIKFISVINKSKQKLPVDIYQSQKDLDTDKSKSGNRIYIPITWSACREMIDFLFEIGSHLTLWNNQISRKM